MALFDQFGPAQANNGQAPPSPQATFGAPGFPFGSWGNQPPNMAGGLQQFLAARGMARPQPGATQPPMQPPTPPAQPPGAGAAVMPQTGNPMVASQGPSSAAVMPQGATAGASSPYGATNFAGGMQPFVGARRA
jgi:hypothetical protein